MISTEFLVNFVPRHRLLVSLAMAAFSALAVYGHLYESPLRESADDGARQAERPRLSIATDEFERRARDCFLVVETDDLFTPRTVAALRSMVETVEELDYVERIFWVDRIPVLNAFGLAEPLLPPNGSSVERFRDARSRVFQHPLARGQLLSEDGKTLLMPITFDWLYVTSDEDCTQQLLRVARRAAAAADVKLRIRLTGRVPLFIAHQQAFRRNQFKFQAIAYGLVSLLAIILFRGIAAVLIVAGAPALGVFWTLGVLSLLDELSNPLTNVVLPVLLTMVGLTDGVHLMVHIRRMRASGLAPREAAASAIRHVGLACALTSLTTAIGFGSLMMARSEFVQGFGRSCAIGVLITFVAVVTFIPLMCSTRLGRTIHRGHEHDIVGRSLRRFGGVIDVVLRRARLFSALGFCSTIAFALVALTLRPDDKMRDSQPTGSEAYQALQHCDRALGGIEFLRVIVQWPSTIAHDSPSIMYAIQDAQLLLNSEPLVRHPLSIRNIVEALPGDTDLAGRMSFLELLPESVKTAYFNTSKRSALITARIQDLGIATYEPVFGRLEEQFTQLEAKYPGFHFQLAGDPVRRGRNLYRIVVDLAASLGTASIIILVVMTIVYRSLRLGLITIVPNMFPLVVTASMLVFTGRPLEIASVCSFTVCLGIAVDDTIHFLTRFQDEVAVDGQVDGAIRRTFIGVGTALIITTVILVSGFSTVLTSDLPGHRSFAAMACSTIAAALIGDLIFLPALLSCFSKARREE